MTRIQRRLRQKCREGMSRRSLARRLNCSHQAVCDWVEGKPVGRKYLVELLEVLDFSEEERVRIVEAFLGADLDGAVNIRSAG